MTYFNAVGSLSHLRLNLTELQDPLNALCWTLRALQPVAQIPLGSSHHDTSWHAF